MPGMHRVPHGVVVAPVLIAGIVSVFSPSQTAIATDEDLIAEGARVYATVAGLGCKTCHGEFAEGDLGVGPFIRGAPEGAIRAAIDATNEMLVVKQAISEDEIVAVAAYLGRLGTMQVVRTLVKRGRFLPDEVGVRPGTRVQLVIQNAGLDEHTFRSTNMGLPDVVVAARSAGTSEWIAPDEEGEYSLHCVDCKLDDEKMTIRVDASAAEFRQVAPANAAPTAEAM